MAWSKGPTYRCSKVTVQTSSRSMTSVCFIRELAIDGFLLFRASIHHCRKDSLSAPHRSKSMCRIKQSSFMASNIISVVSVYTCELHAVVSECYQTTENDAVTQQVRGRIRVRPTIGGNVMFLAYTFVMLFYVWRVLLWYVNYSYLEAWNVLATIQSIP